MNIEKLKQLKELLDMGAISQSEYDEQKSILFKNKESEKSESKILTVIIITVIIICFTVIIGVNSEISSTSSQISNAESETSIPQEFSQACPIEISSSIYDNIIGMPEIKCNFKNNTDKEITAIKLYFSPKDVYGEDVNTIFTSNELYTDNSIPPGESDSRVWQLLDSNIKSGDIYVYSVYFSNKTEWGNKKASVSDIKKYAYKIHLKY